MSRILNILDHVGEGGFRSGLSVDLPDEDGTRWAQHYPATPYTCYLVNMLHC